MKFSLRFLNRLENLPRRYEVLLWLVVLAAALGFRVNALHLLPEYIWSKDAGSYTANAFHWLDQGEWIFDGRRGGVYTLFIGYATRLFGSLRGVMWTQQILSFLAVSFTCAVASFHFNRRGSALVAACGLALALYGPPVRFAWLIRNDLLLFVCACVAFGSWAMALRGRPAAWLALSGLAGGVLSLAKSVFVPFPLLVAAGALWVFRKTPLRAVASTAAFLLAYGLPFALNAWHDRVARVHPEPEPQMGLLWYARVAQFTVLDRGIEPELKAQIRPEIEEYRKRHKLDNNIILHRTAVPHLLELLRAQGKTPTDLEHLCRRLALEAIAAHPREYARQMWGDFGHLQRGYGESISPIFPAELKKSIQISQTYTSPHPMMEQARNVATLQARAHDRSLLLLRRWERFGWLFLHTPVLWTTLLLPVLCWCYRREREAWFWIGLAGMWFFTMLMLCTVGKPMLRYLMPMVPVMFWTLSASSIGAVRWLSDRWGYTQK